MNLTHCDLVRPYRDTEIYVNTDSGKGLLPVGTKPLSEQMLTHFGHAMRYVSLWVLKC